MKILLIHLMKRGSVCVHFFQWVITVSESVGVVQVDSLITIPSELQVRQAITKLYEKQEEFPDKFSYIKFPTGTFDYGGLHMLLTYHEFVALREKVAEERAWLNSYRTVVTASVTEITYARGRLSQTL